MKDINVIIKHPHEPFVRATIPNTLASLQEVVGGGISRLSSALYYCALKADLEILERTAHTYAPNFIDPGLDADVQYGKCNFSFKNTTGRPIRIVTSVSETGSLTVQIWGTANKSYRIDIVSETL